MKPDTKKDALTDVVEIATTPQSDNSDEKVGEGQAVASSGEVVTLGMEKEIDAVARKLVKQMRKKKQ
jgi:hypothetical protein